MSANAILAFTALQAALKTTQELAAMLQKAQMEGRDITDAEIAALKLGNDVLSQDLISRLKP